MEHDNILDMTEVMDESQNIRRVFHPRDGSGWVPHGRYTVLGKNGRPLLEITYQHGVVDGPYLDYWPSGKVACEGQFQDGKQESIWHFYNENGTLREILQFKQDNEIGASQYSYNEDGTLREITKTEGGQGPKKKKGRD